MTCMNIVKLLKKSAMLNLKQENSTVFVYGAIAILFSLFFLFYLPTLSVLHDYWSEMSNAYAHGYMLLATTIYLLYLTRKNIFLLGQKISIYYFLINLTAIFLSTILWFLAYATQIQIIQLFTAILLIWLWVAVVFGRSSAIHAAIPIGLLFMAIPLWDGIEIYLQAMTVFITQLCLSWFGVSFFLDGNFIQLPDGVIEIAESCSGLKYFLAGTSLAIIYSEMNINTIQRKIGIVLLAVILSITANWIRVFSLVLIADSSKMQSSLVYDHDNFGWVIFIVCFSIFFVIANRVDPGIKKDMKINKFQSSKSKTVRLVDNYYFRALSATLVAGILPVFSWSVVGGTDNYLLSHQLQFLNAKKIRNPAWAPNYTGFDESNTWRAMVNEREVDITIVSYRTQKQGKELIYYSNTLNDSSYQLMNIGHQEISKSLSINRSILSNQANKMLVGWYYKVGDYETTNEKMAKWLQITSIFRGVPIASLVTISMLCKSRDCSNEKEHFLSHELIKDISNSIRVSKS